VNASLAAHRLALAQPPPADPVVLSPAMREMMAAVDDVAETPTTVLLLGESGTGKEVVARYIHRRSSRAAGPWIAVNCAALPADLLESELFGHERGAFTGAADRRIGRFEQATGGTLLLDEVSELPLALQGKLLRAIQEREIDRVGGHGPVVVDVRIIAASNRDVAGMVARGQFRSDLFYRLNVFPVVVPPLRERRADLGLLALQLVAEAAAGMDRAPPELTPEAIALIAELELPGNVRELGNLLERALVRCRGARLDVAQLRSVLSGAHGAAPQARLLPPEMPLDLGSLERLAIEEALRRVNGNRTHAARLLGIGIRTLRNKLRAWRDESARSTATVADRQFLPGETCLPQVDGACLAAPRPARVSQGSEA
jgi:two-component system response regulator FlrC